MVLVGLIGVKRIAEAMDSMSRRDGFEVEARAMVGLALRFRLERASEPNGAREDWRRTTEKG